MSVASDDILTRPLGAKPTPRERVRALAAMRPTPRLMLGVLGLGFITGVSILVVTGDPQGGEPVAIATISLRDPPPTPVAATPASEKPIAAQRSADAVETASGVTVVRAGGGNAPSEAVVIRVPDTAPVKLAPAPDPRLVERGRHGSVPRLGEGRVRALDIYARPDPATTGPRIAILVSGLGIGQSATASAITRLPPEVSLAFGPYGSDLERTVARAREAGHEALLQAPMEPFDYPDSDPGPQTLLTTARIPENIDRLAWAMSRFSGFIGIVNYMGAKLTSDAAAFEPVLREVAARGLGYVDDGTSPRSLAATLGAKVRAPTARAEIVLDALPRPEAIDRELTRAEAQARAKGFVLVSATAMPMTIDRIARWSKDLEARGVRLVPVSVALRGPAGTRLTSATP
ncbi:divergent polysaccharide deacetylase family protein [Methylobacterium sp. J-090]|uniref:divergent polysaccharide deacetylase family protein n=1 Tax=Methylobacterium sp. J-090 TaxID=2836666 RepID=UPI001FBAF68A|nr:divergent polysaccharide deacetylase family protein [Methylobacterium sp. J-090]MCJ2081266.1 divergent polysaccharide deacetylase family protein [Methylobacterium sp. J-090]